MNLTDFHLRGGCFGMLVVKQRGLICPVSEYDLPFFSEQNGIKDKNGNMYMIATTDKDIIRKHKAYLRQGGKPKAHFNRFANTITFSD